MLVRRNDVLHGGGDGVNAQSDGGHAHTHLSERMRPVIAPTRRRTAAHDVFVIVALVVAATFDSPPIVRAAVAAALVVDAARTTTRVGRHDASVVVSIVVMTLASVACAVHVRTTHDVTMWTVWIVTVATIHKECRRSFSWPYRRLTF